MFWGCDPRPADLDPAAVSGGAAEELADGFADGAATSASPAPAAASACGRGEADPARVGDRPGPACADQDSERHQDDQGRCCAASALDGCCRYDRHGWWIARRRVRRHGRRHGHRPEGQRSRQAQGAGAYLGRCDCRVCVQRSCSRTYPPIAKAAHMSGTVVLHAIISKTGSIESLRLDVSGPACSRVRHGCGEAVEVQAVRAER